MSRFSRLQNGPIRTWAAPESPFRIEYSPALLREVRISSGGVDAFGVLYGVRHGATIRLIATRGRAGLDAVGVFASRVRGQVFLTEQDLERFEKADACVAMVISGETGGFFVRDRDGSIETVRSYQEFSIHGQQVAVVKRKTKWWPWLACLALLPLVFYRPHHPQLGLHLRESEGQLKISWSVPTSETLTILDGGERTYVAIAPGQTTATYARRSGDVTVGIGTVQARFVGAGLPPDETQRMRNSIDALHHQVVALRAASTAQQIRIAALQRRLQ